MHTIKKKLPSLNGIVTFEAAARHLSFTLAATELCVTQAAVSRQIKRLEAQLGVILFVRGHRSLQLTSHGETFQRAVSFGLEHIASVAWELSGARDHEQIQVASTTAFATFWLMPRLNEFRVRYPDLDIRVIASDRSQDHFSAGVDIALTCGKPELYDQECHYLFPELVFPVCAPNYLAGRSLQTVADLAQENLLHLDLKHWQDIGWEPIDWPLWLEQFGVHYQLKHPVLTFNHYPMLMQATLQGQGIALGWQHLTEGLLATKQLIRPLASDWNSERSYYLLILSELPLRTEVTALKDWLLTH